MSDLVPRIEFEDIEPGLKELFRPRVERLGYLGEFFRVMSACPETMKGFFTITESLKKELPDNLSQLISVALSSRLGNKYEQFQNERLSLKLGLSQEWVRSALGSVICSPLGVTEYRRARRLGAAPWSSVSLGGYRPGTTGTVQESGKVRSRRPV